MSDSKLGVLGCIDHAASEGFDGIEFVEGGWQKEWLNPEGAKKIREHCAEKGIEPVAFLIGADVINWGGDDLSLIHICTAKRKRRGIFFACRNEKIYECAHSPCRDLCASRRDAGGYFVGTGIYESARRERTRKRNSRRRTALGENKCRHLSLIHI